MNAAEEDRMRDVADALRDWDAAREHRDALQEQYDQALRDVRAARDRYDAAIKAWDEARA